MQKIHSTKRGRVWEEDEVLLALALYLQTPYTKITSKNPRIIELAGMLGRSAGSVSLKLANLAALDPKVAAQGRKGFANYGKTDESVWSEYVPDGTEGVRRLMEKVQSASERLGVSVEFFYPDIADERAATVSVNKKTETEVIRRERLGQSVFRHLVMAAYNDQCAISGIGGENAKSLVEAAHILDWASSEESRLDPRNGIALNVLLHRAFDLNYIGIDADLCVHVAPTFKGGKDTPTRTYLLQFDGMIISSPVRFEASREYLDQRFTQFIDTFS